MAVFFFLAQRRIKIIERMPLGIHSLLSSIERYVSQHRLWSTQLREDVHELREDLKGTNKRLDQLMSMLAQSK